MKPSMTSRNSGESDSVTLKAMTVGQLADELHQPVSEVIIFLLREGVACNKNQLLAERLVERVARHFGVAVEKHVSAVQHVGMQKTVSTGAQVRAPIVVVIGHVDHGKTTLLDYIRKTRVALREKGGITQHLGAYRVETAHGPIVFLDTPGHEAFTLMRQRGVRVADLAVLMVAADDGVMPQTVEAIKYAQEEKVPLVVAINKIDKATSQRVEDVKKQLGRHHVMIEEWGGDVVCVPVSAKEGTGVDKLLEMIRLQAELLELKTTLTGAGIGYVLEAKIEKGRGPVATIILQSGTLSVGDYCCAGHATARITSLVNTAGVRVERILPADPVQASGFDELPQAGDVLRVVDEKEYRQARAKKPYQSSAVAQAGVAATQEAINIILKADTNSSREALVGAIAKVCEKDCKQLSIVYAGVGPITESDVMLASTARAALYGFGVKPDLQVTALAKKMGVVIENYGVIYHLLDALKAAVEKTRTVEMVTKKIGEAVVRKVFNIKGAVVAGCYVKSGKIVRGGSIVVWRGNDKVGEGEIQTLQREKRSMKEVTAGFECGFIASGVTDYQEDDRVECFVQEAKSPGE